MLIKSVTIKDESGEILLKVICRKGDKYELIQREDIKYAADVRNEKGGKVTFIERSNI